jgi:intracellular sulfur oxidation DsrE/DsrF family protein
MEVDQIIEKGGLISIVTKHIDQVPDIQERLNNLTRDHTKVKAEAVKNSDAIKELQTKHDDNKHYITELENQNEKLQSDMKELKEVVKTLQDQTAKNLSPAGTAATSLMSSPIPPIPLLPTTSASDEITTRVSRLENNYMSMTALSAPIPKMKDSIKENSEKYENLYSSLEELNRINMCNSMDYTTLNQRTTHLDTKIGEVISKKNDADSQIKIEITALKNNVNTLRTDTKNECETRVRALQQTQTNEWLESQLDTQGRIDANENRIKQINSGGASKCKCEIIEQRLGQQIKESITVYAKSNKQILQTQSNQSSIIEALNKRVKLHEDCLSPQTFTIKIDDEPIKITGSKIAGTFYDVFWPEAWQVIRKKFIHRTAGNSRLRDSILGMIQQRPTNSLIIPQPMTELQKNDLGAQNTNNNGAVT